MFDRTFQNPSEEQEGCDSRAKVTLSGGKCFILPDYFDVISVGATGEVYEAVMSLLKSGNEEHFRELLSQDRGVLSSPSYEALVYFLQDTYEIS